MASYTQNLPTGATNRIPDRRWTALAYGLAVGLSVCVATRSSPAEEFRTITSLLDQKESRKRSTKNKHAAR